MQTSDVSDKLLFVCKKLSTFTTFNLDCFFFFLWQFAILSWLFINETLKFNPQLEHGWCLFSPCTYFVWTFSCPLDASHLEQMLQINLIFFLWRLRFSDPPWSVSFDVPIQSVFVNLFFVAQIANKRQSDSNEDWVKYYQAFTCWKRKQKFYTTSAAALHVRQAKAHFTRKFAKNVAFGFFYISPFLQYITNIVIVPASQ